VAASFAIRGPFKIPLDRSVRAKAIKVGCPEFWQHKDTGSLASECGCYVFCRRAGGGITPVYVGKATRTFKQECFAPQKIAQHYQPALLNWGKGRPVMFLVVLQQKKGPVNAKAIKKVELFLIQNATKKNPHLSNIKGIKKQTWSIKGVIRAGKGEATKASQSFKAALGL
jgi:hypothetical protein